MKKVSPLTQDMEYVGDNYLENINVMVSWGFVLLRFIFILFHKIFS